MGAGRTARWALGAVALPLALAGCATRPLAVEPERPRAQPAVRPGRPGFVIAAPHGGVDRQTGAFAAELARRTGFGLVVPTGGPAPGAIAADYERQVLDAAQGPLRYLAEIRGTSGGASPPRIEIATVGVDVSLAQRLRSLYELIRDAHLRGHPAAPRVEVAVEPADPVPDAATLRPREGVLRLPARALHLELPRVTRTEARELYVAILADFLAQAATLPAGR